MIRNAPKKNYVSRNKHQTHKCKQKQTDYEAENYGLKTHHKYWHSLVFVILSDPKWPEAVKSWLSHCLLFKLVRQDDCTRTQAW
jgi:hypothetical protein